MFSTFNWFFIYSSKGLSPLALTAEQFGCVYSKLVQIRSKTFVCRLTRAFSVSQWWYNGSLMWSISAVQSNFSSLLNVEKQQLFSGWEVSITFAPQRDAAVTCCWWIYEYVIWQEGGFKKQLLHHVLSYYIKLLSLTWTSLFFSSHQAQVVQGIPTTDTKMVSSLMFQKSIWKQK